MMMMMMMIYLTKSLDCDTCIVYTDSSVFICFFSAGGSWFARLLNDQITTAASSICVRH